MDKLDKASKRSITNKAQEVIAEVLKPGDYAIDATVGNGNDTFFLASEVGPQGQVIGFDIQQLAIHRANVVLGEALLLNRVTLMQRSHHRMSYWVPREWVGSVKAIMFNLGYLPRGDKSIVTKADTTVSAIEHALKLIAPGGRISIVVYPGHEEGTREAEAVRAWIYEIPKAIYGIELIVSDTPGKEAPELFVITRMI